MALSSWINPVSVGSRRFNIIFLSSLLRPPLLQVLHFLSTNSTPCFHFYRKFWKQKYGLVITTKKVKAVALVKKGAQAISLLTHKVAKLKSSKILGNSRKFQKILGNPKKFQKILENNCKSQEILGNLRKFQKILENTRKSQKIIGSLRQSQGNLETPRKSQRILRNSRKSCKFLFSVWLLQLHISLPVFYQRVP